MNSREGTSSSSDVGESFDDLPDGDLQLKFNDLLSVFKNVNSDSEDLNVLAAGLRSGLKFAECALAVIDRALRKLRAEEEISERLRSKVEEKEVELERARRILNEAVKCSEERVNARREFEELKER